VARGTTPTPRPRDLAIIDFSKLLHGRLQETLEDLVKILQDEKRAISELQHEKRVQLARGYLTALGLTLDDLRPIDVHIPETARLH
jgi:hypothetical protein